LSRDLIIIITFKHYHPHKPIFLRYPSKLTSHFTTPYLHYNFNNKTAIMSSIVNKVKDALHSNKHDDTTHSTTTGTHGTTGTHTTGTHTTGAHTTGTHTTGTGYSTNDGPHSSNLANKADPRVDSDRDHSRNAGVNPHGTASTETYGSGATHGTGLTGSHGTTGSGLTGSHGTTGTHGTHGLSGTTGSSGLGTHSAVGNTGHTGSSTLGGSGYNSSTNAGPHSSNLANKVDPRVDSDLDRSRNAGVNPHGTSTTETYGHSGATHGTGLTGSHGTTGSGLTGSHGTTGTHGSGLTGSHGTTGTHTGAGLGHTGPGPAPNTAGPHKSDALNKVDPRVDSDLDGSKTVGGNQTYSRA
jgi:hypothetical protein